MDIGLGRTLSGNKMTQNLLVLNELDKYVHVVEAWVQSFYSSQDVDAEDYRSGTSARELKSIAKHVDSKLSSLIIESSQPLKELLESKSGSESDDSRYYI